MRGSNTEAIARGTGRSWPEWLAFLEAIGARELDHREIAHRVRETGDASGWWAQAIAVAFEQHTGRRAPGQDGDGSFAFTVTKMIEGELDAALARWCALMDPRRELDGVELARPLETSRSAAWRYWRCALADGSRVSATLHAKAPGKAGLGVGHERLGSPADAERWRAFWKDLLKRL
jgi:hypothetical protein